MKLENLNEEFVKFWKEIGAQGDIDAAIKELNIQHNSSLTLSPNYLYRMKLKLFQVFRIIKK